MLQHCAGGLEIGNRTIAYGVNHFDLGGCFALHIAGRFSHSDNVRSRIAADAHGNDRGFVDNDPIFNVIEQRAVRTGINRQTI